MRLFKQTSNLGLLSLLLWNSPQATPAALPLTAPCPTQYVPSASEERHHYFSLPRCPPFWRLPLQRMPETSWRSLAVKACPSFCCTTQKIPRLLPTLHPHSVRLAAWNLSRRHSRSRHPSSCRLHFAPGYHVKRPALCLHLRVLALHPPNHMLWPLGPTPPLPVPPEYARLIFLSLSQPTSSSSKYGS